MEDLIKQQKLLNGYISRMWSNAQKLGQARITKAELQSRLLRLDDYWAEFQERHFKLAVIEGVEETEYISKDLFTLTEDAYFQIRSKFITALEPPPAVKITTDQAGREVETSTLPLVRQLQLPKISLPKFSGDLLAWESFRDLFHSLVHEVADLSKVQKLQYLKSSLASEALDVIANMPLTESAYDGAWKDLLMRYDNPRVLLFTHMRSLISCVPITKVFVHASRAFKSLKRPVETWDDWFVHLLVSKLDANSRLHWETSLADSRSFPSFTQLQDYLENRMRALEAAKFDSTSAHPTPANTKTQKTACVSANATTTTKSKIICLLCAQAHSMQYCAKFKAMTIAQRHDQVKKGHFCFNCLKSGHSVTSCPATGRCLVCGEKHHTMVHGSTGMNPISEEARPAVSSPAASSLSTSISSMVGGVSHPVLLTTARVILEGESGQNVEVRALLDTGSEASFVTEWVAQRLSTKRKAVKVSVVGLQCTHAGDASSSVMLTLRSRTCPSLRLRFESFVMLTLTNLIPVERITGTDWPHLRGLPLADPSFDVPSRVDAVLGADVYAQVLEPAICRGPSGSPTAQLTTLGWILTDSLVTQSTSQVSTSYRVSVHHTQPTDELAAQLHRFWEVEDVVGDRPPTLEEAYAKEHFRATHARENKQGAMCSERRADKQPELRKKYQDFMVEYLVLDHMEPVPLDRPIPRENYYLPHHAVFKTGNLANKIRVVFNASSRTTSGLSLNDCLLAGPKLQPDLWLILTRWRFFCVGFITDVVKMFRQIRIHTEDADLQQIL